MGKKRKTRQQKVIAQLRRELAKKEGKTVSESTQAQTRQGAKIFEAKTPTFEPEKEKKLELPPLSIDNHCLKKDLLKTLALTVAVLSLELVLYLKLG